MQSANASSVDMRTVAGALHTEMRVRLGPVPEAIADAVMDEDGFVLSRNALLFTTRSGVRFHYARGEGVTAWLPDPACQDDFQLFLWGTVFGAVAWLNGYFPLHASAVEVDGRAVAFTADSGGGKSTLAAALAGLEWPHVADDTLPLIMDGTTVLAVPDGKPLKLWEDAFALVAAERIGPITTVPGKSYARAPLTREGGLPLAHLIVLEEGPALTVSEVTGVAKLEVLVAAMYRDFMAGALGRRADYHRTLLALANGIGIWRLARPRSREPAEFRQLTERIAEIVGSIRYAN